MVYLFQKRSDLDGMEHWTDGWGTQKEDRPTTRALSMAHARSGSTIESPGRQVEPGDTPPLL